MTAAPNRGARKCETCIHFTDKRPEWDKFCKRDRCECMATKGDFGIAFCPDYKGKTYVDTSGMGLSGPGAGFCEWKCPPILKRVLFGEWGQRLVAATDWCHCHEERVVGPTIAGLRELGPAPALSLPSRECK